MVVGASWTNSDPSSCRVTRILRPNDSPTPQSTPFIDSIHQLRDLRQLSARRLGLLVVGLAGGVVLSLRGLRGLPSGPFVGRLGGKPLVIPFVSVHHLSPFVARQSGTSHT